MSEDIAYRQSRYLIMMGIRLVCFVIAVVLFANGAGWFTAIPAAGGIVIPLFAVIFANGGREPTSQRGFQAYEPNLPARYSGPAGSSRPGTAEAPAGGPGSSGPDADMAGNNGGPSPKAQTGHLAPPGNG
jgi:Protein of unknown function (DUF3099)